MSGVPGWQEAVALPWLRPSTAALLALTAEPPDAATLLLDPAALIHVFRFVRPTLGPHDSFSSLGILCQPSLAANAAALLTNCRQEAPDWHVGPLERVNRVMAAASAAAGRLALDAGQYSPEVAQSVTRLTAMGWYALFAVNPTALAVRLDEAANNDRRRSRRLLLNPDASAATRRLAGRWRLPPWVIATIGYLHLPAEDAERLGAQRGLFEVIQTAVWAAERHFGSIGLTVPKMTPRSDSSRGDAERIVVDTEFGPRPRIPSKEFTSTTLLVQLLQTTAAARRAGGATWLAESEDRVDALCETLADLRVNFESAVRDAKLAALAEFAAGASHEINNPLAVISGHAQLLLNREPDPERRKQLGVIVRQTQRIHDLLQGTLQFARPSRPTVSSIRVSGVVTRVLSELEAEAQSKNLRLDFASNPEEPTVRVDQQQIRHALLQVLRNAITAAADGGWVGVCLEVVDGRIEVGVEDNGPGPSQEDVDHLFDPFYSGRSAGRGRGLGLAIAWRLATNNGGEIRYEPSASGPTRFVLSFPVESPCHSTRPISERKCA